ncbi:response regulator transcription factor [Roseomonas populi]|uniref:Response regulator n=1 Tax=Roseomonas populi TaxID=3121582 RepID=A0ABT1X5B4_9PROT|nr:response regulator [Roseomonas pecuniae]MCR0982352.1 response regulator [Roseomonas pecuniae]
MRDHLIAIVDDDDSVRVALTSLARSAGLRARAYASANAFLAEDLSPFDCVVSDIQMPELSGFDLLRAVRSRRAELPVILITAFPDERVRQRAMGGGARFFLEKPCDPNVLITRLTDAMEEESGP